MNSNWSASRRAFLQSAGTAAGGAILLRYAPSALLAQANALEARRAQIGAAPIETT
jgi:phospholipase C